jgi:hypothetical protein
VSHGLGLVDDLHLRLVVVEAARVHLFAGGDAIRTADVEQELREREVLLLARHAIEFHQPHLGDLMTRPDGTLSRPEGVHEQVRAARRDVEQGLLSGGEVCAVAASNRWPRS